MRIITGAPVFFASSAGMAIVCVAGDLAAEAAAGVLADDDDLLASTPTHRATDATVCATLCVEPCRYSLPFCQ